VCARFRSAFFDSSGKEDLSETSKGNSYVRGCDGCRILGYLSMCQKQEHWTNGLTHFTFIFRYGGRDLAGAAESFAKRQSQDELYGGGKQFGLAECFTNERHNAGNPDGDCERQRAVGRNLQKHSDRDRERAIKQCARDLYREFATCHWRQFL
jgi:hypothetical protein